MAFKRAHNKCLTTLRLHSIRLCLHSKYRKRRHCNKFEIITYYSLTLQLVKWHVVYKRVYSTYRYMHIYMYVYLNGPGEEAQHENAARNCGNLLLCPRLNENCFLSIIVAHCVCVCACVCVSAL